MKVPLVGKYVMTSDPHNFILNESSMVKSGKNKGKEHLKAVGFYPTIPQLVEGMISKKMMTASKARTLNGLVREHSGLVADIKSLFSKFCRKDLGL